MPVYKANMPTKDGRQYYYKCYYIDKYGAKRRYESKKYKGVRECERAERDFLINIEKKDITNTDIMFKEVFEEWLEYKKNTIKITSFYCMKKKLYKHLYPFFEKYKLHSIKVNTLLDWKKNMATNSNLKEVSQNTIISCMKEFLDYSIDNYDFDKKVASKLQKIKIDTIKEKKKVIDFWTYEEFKNFIEVVDDEVYYTLFNFLYYTGVRIGEALALNWNDIDFENKTVNIARSISKDTEEQGCKIVSTKTQNSVRILDLDDKLLELLKKHYNIERKIYKFTNDMFVFGNILPLGRSTIHRKFTNYIKESNVKKITIHGFRHSHASLLINLGLDFKDVAERLGDTISVVQNTYYHIFPQKKSNTVNALNKLNNT